MTVKNRLQQYSNDFLMYGRYNVETLDKVIDTARPSTIIRLNLNQSSKAQLGHIDDVIKAVCFGFDLQMYMTLTEEEHINQYNLLGLASKDLLHGITLGQGGLPNELFPDRHLKEKLCEV